MSYIKNIGLINFIIIALFGIGLFSIKLYSGQPERLSWWPLAILFFLWGLGPILVPFLIWKNNYIMSIIVGIIAAYSMYIYLTSIMGPETSSTSSLIFLFLPLWQWAAVILISLAMLLPRIYKDLRKLIERN